MAFPEATRQDSGCVIKWMSPTCFYPGTTSFGFTSCLPITTQLPVGEEQRSAPPAVWGQRFATCKGRGRGMGLRVPGPPVGLSNVLISFLLADLYTPCVGLGFSHMGPGG